MDTTKIKRLLAKCDHDELGGLIRYCQDRQALLLKREFALKAKQAMEQAKRWKVGQVVYCCKNGFSLSHNDWQRGDKGIVLEVFPKARKWIVKLRNERNSLTYWFKPAGLANERFEPEPPNNPTTPEEIARWGKFGNVIDKVINQSNKAQ